MTILNVNETIKAFLETSLPADIIIEVDVTISADKDERQAKDGVKTKAEITFPKTWTIGTLFERLAASNSPKVALQAEYRGEKIPARIKWTCNEPGTRRVVEKDPLKALVKSHGGDVDAAIAALQAEKARRANQR